MTLPIANAYPCFENTYTIPLKPSASADRHWENLHHFRGPSKLLRSNLNIPPIASTRGPVFDEKGPQGSQKHGDQATH